MRWNASTSKNDARRRCAILALAEASLVILNAPERGQPFPRPYPELVSVGLDQTGSVLGCL